MNDQAENSELLKFLESGEIGVVGKIKQVLHENLYSAKDASLLSSLVESYSQSKSENLLGIITGVNESQCQVKHQLSCSTDTRNCNDLFIEYGASGRCV